MNTVTIAAYRRPEYLATVINSLKRSMTLCPEFKIGRVVIGIDPVNFEAGGWTAHEDVVKVSDFSGFEVVTWPEHLGVSEAPRRLLQYIFMEGSDFNLHLEDDTALSPDALRVLRAMTGHPLVCLFAPSTGTDNPHLLLSHRVFRVWGWACSNNVWLDDVASTWNHRREPPLGWDASLEQVVKERRIQVVSPKLSRVHNIGREQGTYQTPEGWDNDFRGQVWAMEEHVQKIEDFRLI